MNIKKTLSLFTLFFICSSILAPIAEARSFGGGGGRSFSSGRSSFSGGGRSSYRSSGSSSGSRSSWFNPKPNSVSTPPKQTVSKPFFQSNRNESKLKNGGFVAGNNTSTSKQSLQVYRSKFKQPADSKPLSKDVVLNRYKTNPVFNKARTTDPSTYYTRRDNYYRNNYGSSQPVIPAYAFNSGSSFGMWDSMFLWMMLDNMSDAGSFGHNHQGDKDYLAWRQEADKLAKDNADLKEKLAKLDTEIALHGNEKVDPNMLPFGMDPDLALAEDVRKATVPVVNICVGNVGGAYDTIARNVLLNHIEGFDVGIVNTAGTPDILNKIIRGDCSAGFVQGDIYWNYAETHKTETLPIVRVSSPLKETVHLLCNKDSGVSNIDDLSDKNVMFLAKDSGAIITWNNLLVERKELNVVSSSVTNSAEDAYQKVNTEKNACMLYVGSDKGTKFMTLISGMADRGKSNVQLVSFVNDKLLETVDPAGEQVYGKQTLSYVDHYGLLWHTIGRQIFNVALTGGTLETMYTHGDFVISEKWKKEHEPQYGSLVLQIQSLEDQMKQIVNQ